MTVAQRSVGTSSPRAKVVLVDDDPLFLNALSRVLRFAGYDVEAFADPQQVLGRAPDDSPCCMVLDLRMPELDGLALMDALVAARVHPHIVFLTGHGDVPTAMTAMKRGAVDFLTKPVNTQDLLDAVACAVTRDAEARATRAALHGAQALLTRLTPREREVCELVAQGKLNKEIASELGPAEKTVKVHRGRALKKLHVSSVAELVRLLDRARAG
ncbi:MAG TPA: response regulator [Kofleriaceae bacterium]|nr:response regulator [Kofleriaceae bacterium]